MFTAEGCRRIVADLTGEPYREEWEFSGCGIYVGGVRCGSAEVERLYPIAGDHEGHDFATPVCDSHLREHLDDHLLR